MTADQTNESIGLAKELIEQLTVHNITTTKYFFLSYIKTVSENITKILTLKSTTPSTPSSTGIIIPDNSSFCASALSPVKMCIRDSVIGNKEVVVC